MSGTASNYDVKKLMTGQVIAALASVMAGVAAGPFIVSNLKASIPFIAICLFYGIMMFASSYVEEEQHFWYWTTTGWLFLLSIKKYGSVNLGSRCKTNNFLVYVANLVNFGCLLSAP